MDRVQKIIEMTCQHFGVSEVQLKAKSRKREFVVPRHVAQKLINDHTASITLSLIGQVIGGRDHSSVLHGIGAINDLMDVDKEFKAYYLMLEEQVKIKIEKLPDKTIHMWKGMPAPITNEVTGKPTSMIELMFQTLGYVYL